MKNGLFLLTFILLFGISKSQDLNNEPIRFIEVTGSAELEIEPDEIRLIIGIEEYWKEEFEKKTEFKDYKTKIPIVKLENKLLIDLANVGIQEDDIIIKEVGNYWRYKGKEFLISKQFELILTDFKKVDEIIQSINTKGIKYMRIGELKNKNITDYRKQVKIEALKAAKNKADYLLSSIDKQVGEIISIIEFTADNNFWRPQSMTSNVVMAPSDNSGINNLRKIKLRYEIKAKFEIK
ncbi:MAG: SIMPL domain-containing protein [Bacteroidales bacterium]|nr:SIMPL domain-containing protein [Bacteroidales bacterium]